MKKLYSELPIVTNGATYCATSCKSGEKGIRRRSWCVEIQFIMTTEGFFREGNLDALRELVLKRVVHEVEQDLTEYMHEHGLQDWEAAGRCLVILEKAPDSEVAIRRAWRMARAFNGDLTAVYPACLLKEQGMTHLLAVARDLNIALREIAGEDFMREISDLIRAENIVHVTLLAGHEGRFLGCGGSRWRTPSWLPTRMWCSPCRTRRRLTGPLAERRVRQAGRGPTGSSLGKLWHPRPHAQRRFFDRDLVCHYPAKSKTRRFVERIHRSSDCRAAFPHPQNLVKYQHWRKWERYVIRLW